MTFDDTCRTVQDVQGHKTLLLSFSRGKDSLAAFLRCYESGLWDRFILIHMSMLDLSFFGYLNYFRSRYPDVTIVDIMEPSMNTRRNALVLQTPLGVVAMSQTYMEIGPFSPYKWTDLERYIKEDYNLTPETLTGVGIKMVDSPMRRLAISKNGSIAMNRLKWYPVADLTDAEVGALIKRHNLKLPRDYEYWGRTFDGFDYYFLKYIFENLPKDLQKIREEYPLIDLVYSRREHYFGTLIKKRRFQYEKYGLQVISQYEEEKK